MSSPSPRRSVDSFESLPSPSSQRSQFPFPQHDWTQRPSSTGRYQPRRGSTASSIHSVGGVLDTSSQGRMGSVRESGQNGIYIMHKMHNMPYEEVTNFATQLSRPYFNLPQSPQGYCHIRLLLYSVTNLHLRKIYPLLLSPTSLMWNQLLLTHTFHKSVLYMTLSNG
jgi:hypothetical protein